MVAQAVTYSMNLSRKDILRGLPLLLLVGLGGAGQVAPARRVMLSKEEAEMLDRISDEMNAVVSMKGRFAQIGPQGQIDQGTFYLQRPGRARFEYAAPSPVLIVAGDGYIAVANRKLGTVDRYPLSQTPFQFLLADKIDLRHSEAVLGVDIAPGSVTLKARTDRVRFRSDVRFVFATPGLELRQWTVTDVQGLNTTVTLSDVERGGKLEPSLFALPQPSKPGASTRKN